MTESNNQGEAPLYCENFDLENVVTPVKANKLINYLRRTKYDEEEIKFLEQGFTRGFNIEYHGPQNRQSQSNNIPFTVWNKTQLWNKLMKEVGHKRVAGPFRTIPFENYIQSPIGLVPKVGGNQTRLIFHLSYDCKEDDLKSVNHHTPRDKCAVHYQDLDYAIAAYLNVLGGSEPRTNFSRNANEQRWRNKFDNHWRLKRQVFAGKSDLRSAFRILGLSEDSWKWLVMKAQDPNTSEWNYFVDKCLPFGASISCSHFQRFLNALCHIFEHQNNVQGQVTNYLDDFLFLALTVMRCNMLIEAFINLCTELGIPISKEKTEWGSLYTIFLGILLNGKDFCLGLPLEKKDRAIHLLQAMKDRKKSTVKELQSLCGFLNFISRAVFPGRTFTRRMYAKFSKVMSLPGGNHSSQGHLSMTDKGNFVLKPHHHVRLDAEFKKDCKTWLQFLDGELEVVQWPMVDLLKQTIPSSEDICFFSDASRSKNSGGFGCLLNSSWIQGFWEPGFIEKESPSIEYLELYALTAGILTWENKQELVNGRITIFCDNQSVVQMINNGMVSSCRNCMRLLQMLTLNGLRFNSRISAKFVPTKKNSLADALSWGQWERFRRLGPHMNKVEDKVNEKIWPVSKIWISGNC